MVGDRSKYDARRREFRQQRPDYFCPHCTSILFASDEECIECLSPRPPSGWAPLSEGFDPCLGKRLGERYLVTKFVGVGGTGNVYRAESLTILRQFAIKIIDANRERAKGGAEKIRARLEREIEALSQLRNPHIVPFYEVLELPGNFLGVVMDYVDGVTLENLVHEEGPLTIVRTCKIARQIAIGVHEAHAVGMTHRDLKPENIMIERLPLGDEFAHILDFGIVQLSGDSVRMTQGFLGTPLYASPEQAMGREVDRRSDIYSFGALLFFVLTGQPPFIGNNSFEVLDAHIRTPAPQLAEAFSGRTYPEAVQALVSRMLSKSQEDRPQDLRAVIAELDAIRLQASEVPEAPFEAEAADPGAGELATETIGQTARGRPLTARVASPEPETGPPATGELPPLRPETGPVPVVAPETGPLPSSATESSSESAPPRAEILRRGGPSGKFRSPTPSAVTRSPEASEKLRSPGARSNVFRQGARRTPSRRIRPLAPLGGNTRTGTTDLNLVGEAPKGAIQQCVALHDGGVALVGRDNVIWVLTPGDDQEGQRLGSVSVRATAMAAVRSGVLVGREDGAVDFVVLDSGRKRQPFDNLTGDSVVALGADPAGQLVIVGARSGRVLQARGVAGKKALKVLQHGRRVDAVAVNTHGDTFAVSRSQGTIEIYNVGTPQSPFSALDTEGKVSQMAFSKDGHIIALMFAEARTVHLHHVFTGHRLMSYAGNAGRLVGVRFTDENELIGMSVVDGSIYSWDLQSTMVALPR